MSPPGHDNGDAGMPELSVVIPVYNEGVDIASNLQVVLGILDDLRNTRFELLVIDDGSTDNTVTQVTGLARQRPEMRLVVFTRNFGKEAAILAGLEAAAGRAAIVMDSDLQHPPHLIPEMLEAWRAGAYIVEAVKIDRGLERWTYKLCAQSFYRLFDWLSGLNLNNQSDFKLLDRKVIDAYRAMPEKGRFFRGLIDWLAYPAARLPFEVPKRAGGGSTWSNFRLFRYSVRAVTSFSALPLQLVTILGMVTLAISLVFGVIALHDKMVGTAVSGFTTVILLVLIIGSILMVSVGLVGIYVARVYEEIKGRPNYVIRPSSRQGDK